MSVKAKANMMGELGADLEWTDKSTDKDWSHYSGSKAGETVVVFFDGIEMPSSKWWWENIKVTATVGEVRRRKLEHSLHRTQSNRRQIDAALGKEYSQVRPPKSEHDLKPLQIRPSVAQQGGGPSQERPPTEEQGLLAEDLWGSNTPLRAASPASARSMSRGRQSQPRRAESVNRGMSTPTRLSKYMTYEQEPVPTPQPMGPSPSAVNGKARNSSPSAVQRSSVASIATSGSARLQDRTSNDYETGPLSEMYRGTLHHKTASPSLRHAS